MRRGSALSAAALQIPEDSPHDRHNVVIRAHHHHLGGRRARLQRERRSVTVGGESPGVVDHLAQQGGLRFTGKRRQRRDK